MSVLQFTIKLTDMMSATLKKVAGNSVGVDQAFKRIAASQQKMKAAMGEGTISINSLNEKIAQLQKVRNLLPDTAERQIRAINSEVKQLNKQLQHMETMNGSKVKVWAGDAFNQLPFAGLLKNPLVITGAAATYGVKQAMEVQMNKVKFGTLMGSDKAGDAMYGQLKNYADVTPYRKDDILGGGETLLNFGVKSNKILPTIKMLGDISGGSAERLQSLSLAFGEVTASGHLTGKQVLQMVNAGFNPLQAMSQRTGKSMETLSGMMREGQITVGMVEDAMKTATGEGGRFHNMMIKLGGTLQGQMSTFMDKVQNAMAELGGALMPMATGALQFLNVALEKTVGFFKGLFGWISNNRNGLIALVSAIAAGIVTYSLYSLAVNAATLATKLAIFWTDAWVTVQYALLVAQDLLNAAFLASPVGLLVVGVAALVGSFVLLKSAMTDAYQENKKMNDNFAQMSSTVEINNGVMKKAKDGIAEGVTKATMLIKSIQDTHTAEKDRKEALKELHELDSKSFENIHNQSDAYKLATTSLAAYTKQMLDHAEAMAGVTAIQDLTKNAIDQQNKNRELTDKTIFTHQVRAGNTTYAKEWDKDTSDRMRTNMLNNLNNPLLDNLKKGVDYITTQFVKKDKEANSALKNINAPTKAMTDGAPTSEEDDTAKGIAKGGPRVINITINKLVEKIDIHSSSVKEGLNDAAEMIKEPFLRMLYSGAKMQS